MKRLFISLALLGLIIPQSIRAQEDAGRPGPTAPSSTYTGNVSCSDYYQFGSVATSLEADVAQTVPGANITFSGTITNKNNYPVVNGSLFVKIFHKDETTFRAGDGNPVVDQFFVKDTFNLAAQGEKKISFSWHVPENAQGGEYYAATFFTTENRYNLSGLSFTDDVIGSSANFSVTSDQKGGVFLDKSKTALNGSDHHFAAYPLHFKNDETVETKVTLTNPSSEDQVVQLVWEEYAWDAMRVENLQNKRFDLVEVAANSSKEVTYQVTPKGKSVSYLVVTAKDQYSKSVQGIRFVRDGIEETRINFPSLTHFPLKSGEQNSVFACAHATNLPLVKGNILTLTLRDENQNIIHEYKYEGDISGAMSGWKDDFTPSESYDKVFLTATLQRNNEVVEEVTIPYDCEIIDKNLCGQGTGFASLSKTKKIGVLFISLLSLIALCAIFISKTKTRKANRFKILFLLLMAGGMFFGGGGVALGKSVSWSKTEPKPLAYEWNCSDGSIGSCGGASGWELGLGNPSITVIYSADAYNVDTGASLMDGATIPLGTRIQFVPKTFNDTDISWFGTGYSSDSPNGHWISGAAAPAFGCFSGDQSASSSVITGGITTVNTYSPLSVNPPGVNINTNGSTATLTPLGGNMYRVDSPGSINGNVVFDSTYGEFYYRYLATAKSSIWLGKLNTCYGNQTPMDTFDGYEILPICISIMGSYCPVPGALHSDYQLSVPIQTVSFTFNTPSSNNPPATPSLTGPSVGSPSTNYPYDTQAADPDGDNIRYGIDWDNNNTVDEWTAYVPSNTALSTNHSWALAGSYTFKALAQDSNGASSGWSTPLTMTIGGGGGSCVWQYKAGFDDISDFWAPVNGTPLQQSCSYGWYQNTAPSCDSLGVTQSDDGQPAPPGSPAKCGLGSAYAYSNGGYLYCGKPDIMKKVGTGCALPPASCGAAHNFPSTNPPTMGLCSGGTASAVTPASQPGPYSWTCSGSNNTTSSCTAPYLEPAPIVDLKINGSDGPLTVNRNSNLNITWGAIPNAATCIGTGNNWNGAKSTLTGNDNLAATAASLYTLTCTNSQGISASDAISVILQPTLKICLTQCDSNLELTSPFNMVQGSSQDIRACYNDATTCTDPTGNVTSTATWNENGGSNVVTLTNTDPKTVNANQSGSESISATYSGSTQTKDITVTCTDAGACSRDPRTNNLCLKDSFTVVDACGVTQNCNGAKSCDYNWKEVAP